VEIIKQLTEQVDIPIMLQTFIREELDLNPGGDIGYSD
jgi:hypothetical protein